MKSGKAAIAVHGGAGIILRSHLTPEKETEFRQGLRDALRIGHSILSAGGSSADAVEAAVSSLEDFPLFNAGRGSVFTHEKTHEMDAAIMEGSRLAAGAVAAVSGVKNPVRLARAVMESSDHVLLSGKGAEAFARAAGIEFRPADYFFVQWRYEQLLESLKENKVFLDHTDKKFGTVGAVALDIHGNLAAATSTGGMTNKRFGRIGDSPLIGCGTYANNKTCAVSCTGHGEFFIRAVTAYDISALMEYRSMPLADACDYVVNKKLLEMRGDGGLIAIDAEGNIALAYNCEGMYRGYKSDTEEMVAIFEEKTFT